MASLLAPLLRDSSLEAAAANVPHVGPPTPNSEGSRADLIHKLVCVCSNLSGATRKTDARCSSLFHLTLNSGQRAVGVALKGCKAN